MPARGRAVSCILQHKLVALVPTETSQWLFAAGHTCCVLLRQHDAADIGQWRGTQAVPGAGDGNVLQADCQTQADGLRVRLVGMLKLHCC